MKDFFNKHLILFILLGIVSLFLGGCTDRYANEVDVMFINRSATQDVAVDGPGTCWTTVSAGEVTIVRVKAISDCVIRGFVRIDDPSAYTDASSNPYYPSAGCYANPTMSKIKSFVFDSRAKSGWSFIGINGPQHVPRFEIVLKPINAQLDAQGGVWDLRVPVMSNIEFVVTGRPE